MKRLTISICLILTLQYVRFGLCAPTPSASPKHSFEEEPDYMKRLKEGARELFQSPPPGANAAAPTAAASAPPETPAAAESDAEEEWKPKTHFKSPDERFTIDLQPVEHPDKEGFNDKLLVVRGAKKELARQTTFGFLLDVFWDDSGKYVAVDNRRGNGGDYIWIFTLPDGKCIKQADSNQFTFLTKAASTAIEKIDAHATSDKLEKFRIVAKGWWGNGPKLLVRIVARFDYPSAGGRIDYHWFAYDALVKISGQNFSLVSGEARKVGYVND